MATELMSRIVDYLTQDLQRPISSRQVDWEVDENDDDDDGIGFHVALDNERGLLLYKGYNGEVILGLERDAGGGADHEVNDREYPVLRDLYSALMNAHYDLENMDLDNLVDFFFRQGD